MANNKVVINGQTIIDLTDDTVTPSTLGQGVTAHNAAGVKITGTGSVNMGVMPKYGTCSTAAATATKVITLADSNDWTLKSGSVICVTFTYTNSAENPKFNVNSSGAKSVWYDKAAITTSSLGWAGYAERPQLYIYDGTYWVWIGWSSTVSNMTVAEAQTGTGTTGRSITANVLRQAIDYRSLYNTNLLHNADWGYSLINQRGHTGSVASGKYSIDRWYNPSSNAGTVTPSAKSHIILASGTHIAQKMEIIPEALFGKTVTFAYSNNSNTVYKSTLTFPSSAPASGATYVNASVGYVTVYLGFIAGTYTLCNTTCSCVPYIQIYAASGAVNIRRVWLELGEVCHMETTPPLDYAANLSICCRYLYLIPNRSRFMRASHISTGAVYFDFPLPVAMRDSPNIEYAPVTGSAKNVIEVRPFMVSSTVDFTVPSKASTTFPNTVARLDFEKANHGLTDATLNIANKMLVAEL